MEVGGGGLRNRKDRDKYPFISILQALRIPRTSLANHLQSLYLGSGAVPTPHDGYFRSQKEASFHVLDVAPDRVHVLLGLDDE